MRIYNRKRFAAGLLVMAISGVGLFWGFRADFGAGSLLGSAMVFLAGGRMAVRCLSQEKAREDKVEELDERNRANVRRSKSLAFDITLWAGLAAALALAFFDPEEGPGPCTYIAVGLFFACAFGFIAQSAALLYLDRYS